MFRIKYVYMYISGFWARFRVRKWSPSPALMSGSGLAHRTRTHGQSPLGRIDPNQPLLSLFVWSVQHVRNDSVEANCDKYKPGYPVSSMGEEDLVDQCVSSRR